jgi:hypothetical protein
VVHRIECLAQSFAIHREQNDPNTWRYVFQDGSHNYTIRPRHRQVQENQGGLQLPAFRDSSSPSTASPQTWKIPLNQMIANGLANAGAVVRDENPLGLAH